MLKLSWCQIGSACRASTRCALQAEARCRATAEAALAVELRAAATLSINSQRSRCARLAPTLTGLRGCPPHTGAPQTPQAVPCANAAGPPPAGGCGPAARPGEHGATGSRGMPQASGGASAAHVADADLLEGCGEASWTCAGAGEPSCKPCAIGSRSASPECSACRRAYISAASRASCANSGINTARDSDCLGPARSDAATAVGAGPQHATLASSAADGGSTADCSEYASALDAPPSASAGKLRSAPALASAPASALRGMHDSLDGSAVARDAAGAGDVGGSGPPMHGLCATAGHAGDWEAAACAEEREGLKSGLGSGPVAGPADAEMKQRAAEAEAAAVRLSAALTAAAQRVKAREEQCRRLQAQLGHAQLRLVRSNILPQVWESGALSARSSRVLHPLTGVGRGA